MGKRFLSIHQLLFAKGFRHLAHGCLGTWLNPPRYLWSIPSSITRSPSLDFPQLHLVKFRGRVDGPSGPPRASRVTPPCCRIHRAIPHRECMLRFRTCNSNEVLLPCGLALIGALLVVGARRRASKAQERIRRPAAGDRRKLVGPQTAVSDDRGSGGPQKPCERLGN
jgi:hypothetical protein